ncbi:metal-dependent hydrolase [Rhodococcus zopfii]|uniref:metal-dependent hydrolase n=1 Tax=Rhodococcus zopfii TaxID=43772 RepID=UPI00093339F0|nr:metal-dependent hydrolase [Rhodococcus zopfii]
MVMGPTHAMSGAAVGLAAAAVLPTGWGGPSSLAETFAWAGVCAGSALLPDLDHPQSTVARSFGVVSQIASEGINAVSVAFHGLTGTRRDGTRSDGHRTLTHTLLFAVVLGVVVSVLVATFRKPAIIGTLFLTLGLAIRGLAGDWSKKQGWLAVTLAAALLSVIAWQAFHTETGSVSLGVAVALGCITHCIGDGITREGIPFLAPLVTVNGKRWWEFTLPSLLRIRADGPFEKVVLLPALTVATVVLAVLAVPGFETVADAAAAR